MHATTTVDHGIVKQKPKEISVKILNIVDYTKFPPEAQSQ